MQAVEVDPFESLVDIPFIVVQVIEPGSDPADQGHAGGAQILDGGEGPDRDRQTADKDGILHIAEKPFDFDPVVP